MSLSQGYSIGGGRPIGAEGQRPWRHIIHGTGYCKCCPSREYTHRMNTHPTHKVHTIPLSHMVLVLIHQHKEPLTVGIWGKEEGKCTHDAFCAIQNFQMYARWFCCFNQGAIWMVTFTCIFFFMHPELKRKTPDDLLKGEIFANFPLTEEYSPNPVTRPQGLGKAGPKPQRVLLYEYATPSPSPAPPASKTPGMQELTLRSLLRWCPAPSSDPHRCLS